MELGRIFGRRRRRRGGRLSGAVAGAAAGAGLAYFLDPRRGAGRRAQVVQRAGRIAREIEETAEAGARDLSQRARGIALEARSRVEGDHASDDVLVERVRAKLGRVTAHAHAIHVASRDGRIELRGPVLRSEHAQVVRGIRAVRGVHGVEDRLEPHETAEHVSALQGKPARSGPVPELLQARWAPGIRLLAMVSGAYLLLRAMFGRGVSRIPAGLAGAALLGRVLSESGPARREAARIAERIASERRAREGEPGGAGSARQGARTRTPEVREVKSPAELEAGVASASPRPTFSDRVDRGGKGGDSPPPGGWRTAEEDEARGAAPSTEDVEPETGYVAPPPGAEVREHDLGTERPRDEEEPGSERR